MSTTWVTGSPSVRGTGPWTMESFTSTATVALPPGDYTVRYNAHDLNGNVSRTYEHDVTVGAATG